MRFYHSVLAVAAVLAWGNVARADTVGGRIISASITNSQMQLLFETTGGFSYQVQSCLVTGGRFWGDALSPICATGSLTRALVPALGQTGLFRVLEFTNRAFWYDWRYYYEAPFLSAWGMGTPQNGYAHLDRAYEWYIDQADTGAFAHNNCGPASVTMAIKWFNQGFNKTAKDARNTFPAGGGWWYTSDIINYLQLYSVPSTTSSFTGTNQLMGVLSQGSLVIVCINTSYLTLDPAAEHRVGRFYSYAGGHFLVVKGWRTTGPALLFEVYDSNNWHAVYADTTPKGRNRHLPASDLASAIANWWNYLIVVHPPGTGGAEGAKSTLLRSVDPAQIPHMPGR